MFDGLFHLHADQDGQPCLRPHAESPATVSCPTTGRPLRVATIEAATAAICPSCANRGAGGFASFVGDLRMVYACPLCCQLVWLAGV